MPIHVAWDNAEKTIIKNVFDGPWTVEDFQEAVAQTKHAMMSVEHTVYLIADMRAGGNLPKGFLSAMSGLNRSLPPNVGLAIIVGGNQYTRSVMSVLHRLRITKDNIVMVADMDAARALATQKVKV